MGIRTRNPLLAWGLCMLLWSVPAAAQWATTLQQVEHHLVVWQPKVLVNIKSQALLYSAWQVEVVDAAAFVQKLAEALPDFLHVQVGEGIQEWQQAAHADHCQLRMQHVEASSYMVALSCLKTKQPTYTPLLRHPALHLVWAWQEQSGQGLVEHQWYGVTQQEEVTSVLQTVLAKQFPDTSIESSSLSHSLHYRGALWVISVVPVAEQKGVYVVRWR